MNGLNIDFAYLPKLLWRVWQSIRLRSRKIWISPCARWNGNTEFGGFNTICKGVRIGFSKIGRYTYIMNNCDLAFCRIGSFCSIAKGVKIVRYRHPTDTFVSTSPVFFSVKKQCGKSFVNENKYEEQKLVEGFSAIIGNDVWIGEDVRIIEGVSIGNGAIVTAGAVVTKDVSPYSIVGGVPAKVIRSRFEERQVALLQQSQWWAKSDEWFESHLKEMQDIHQFEITKKNEDSHNSGSL